MHKLKNDFIIYKQESSYIFASKNLNSFERLRLISEEEKEAFLKSISNLSLNTDELEILEKWNSQHPHLFIAPKKSAAQTAKELRTKAQAYKAVKDKEEVITYHKKKIVSADIQFDYNETTLSHMFRNKSEALASRSYGEALCDQLIKSFQGLERPLEIIEIGCGTGLLALNFLNRLKEKYNSIYQSVSYSLFDLSPSLAEKQKKVCSSHIDKVNFISGNIEEYNFSNSYDLVISNEVIADLNVGVGARADLASSEAGFLVNEYQLEIGDFPQNFILNTEAIKLIPKIDKLLNPSGMAFLSEYGSLDEMPIPVVLPGHNEYSINFGHLMKVWEFLGNKGDYGTVGDLLDFKSDYEVLDESVRETLIDHLLPFLGVEKTSRQSYDKQLFIDHLKAKFDNFIHLPFSAIKESKGTLSPYSFKYILLKK